MRYNLLILFFSFGIQASETGNSLVKIVDSIKKSNDTKTNLDRISKLQKKARVLKKKSKNDKEFYFAFDLDKSLDVILRMKKFNVDECYRAKVEHFSLYGSRSDKFDKSELPAGAALSFELLSKICK